MRRHSFYHLAIFISLALLISCGQNRNKDEESQLPTGLVTNPGSATGQGATSAAIINFTREEHDFGTIKEGEKVFWNFRFTNTGNIPLIINRVKTDCGCTAPDYPRTPIAPGEEGAIKVTFDSKGRLGKQIKRITVLSNSERPTNVLTIIALVEK